MIEIFEGADPKAKFGVDDQKAVLAFDMVGGNRYVKPDAPYFDKRILLLGSTGN